MTILGEPGVFVPARYAALFAALLDARARHNGGSSAAGVAALTQEFRQVSAAWQRTVLQESPSPTSEVGSPEVPLPPVAAKLSAMEVASLLKCSDRNVRDLATRGALPGHRSGGRWTFDAHEVASYREERRAS